MPDDPTLVGLSVCVCHAWWRRVYGDAELSSGYSYGATLGTRVHVQLKWSAEGRLPILQPINSDHVAMFGLIQVIIVSSVVEGAQHHQVFCCGFASVFERFDVVDLGLCGRLAASRPRAHGVAKRLEKPFLPISKAGKLDVKKSKVFRPQGINQSAGYLFG